MDLVPLVNGVVGIAPTGETMIFAALAILVALMLVYTELGKRLASLFTNVFLTNWQLALLGSTGLVLSVASGWTTWDGMRNFTKEPVLSLMITFGIQGVMLIVAWLIGESFATGMNHRPKSTAQSNRGLRFLQPIASSVAGILLFSAIAILIYNYLLAEQPSAVTDLSSASLAGWWEKLAIAAPVVLIIVLLIVNAGSDVLEDYVQSLRIMVRSAVLWVMFLACMATSVFFSFDSLFSQIFPQGERARAAELRAQNQVAGVVNDIAGLAAARRQSEQDAYFRTPAWQSYEETLSRLAAMANGAETKLRAYFEQQMRERQNTLNAHREEKATAESQQISMRQRKTVLIGEVARVKEQVTRLAPEVERLKQQIFDKDREVIAKTAEAEAEAGGIGVTSKVGRGPKYRELSRQLSRLQEEKKNLELQLREFGGRLDRARRVMSQSESELKRIDGEIAKLTGRSQTADQLIKTQLQTTATVSNANPSDGLAELAAAREEFRREPTVEALARVQNACGNILGAMLDAPTLREQAANIQCEAGAATEAAAPVFALNTGVAAVKQNCVGGQNLPKTGGADALFAFARRCVQDSGLPSADTGELRKRINVIELNRDDKAHRFVVTSNAFGDGNKLAYLALSIAIAIDALVFMSGLFGANAVRSPLSDVPSHKSRSARQLEDVVANALLPHTFDNASIALEAIHPASQNPPREFGEGWTHEALLPDKSDATRSMVQKVLNAGATIGAVRRDPAQLDRYFVRSELLEFLNQVSKTAFEADKDRVKVAELKKIVSVALQPYVSDHADIVLGHLHPVAGHGELTSQVRMSDLDEDDSALVTRALNAGATLDYVVPDDSGAEAGQAIYFAHSQFYRTLALLSAEYPKVGKRLRLATARKAVASEPRAEEEAQAQPSPLTPSSVPTPMGTKQVATKQPAPHQGARRPASYRATGDEAVLPLSSPITDGGVNVAPKVDSNDRQAHLNQLIAALGIEPLAYLNTSGPAFGPAMATSEAFQKQRSVNPRLHKELSSRDAEARRSLELAYERLAAHLDPQDGWARQMLSDAREEIAQNWSILMLLPNGPYETLFTQMVETFEEDSADGVLSAEEQGLLRVTRMLREAMEANPRDTAGAWSVLESQIEDVSAEIAADDSVVAIPRRATH